MMDHAILKVGLPVKCRKCKKEGRVKPGGDYGGWYKSKIYRSHKIKWYCPKHYEIGRAVDNRFFDNLNTPDPYTAKDRPTIEEELYKLLD